MPIEHASWILPAVEQGFKHKDDLASIFDRILAFLLGKKSRIVITGMPGVGKSVLIEYLTGESYKRGYQTPPQPSFMMDKGKIVEHRKRIHIVTVPGQDAGPRWEAMDEIKKPNDPVTGILHVVANGFAVSRATDGAAVLPQIAKAATIEAYRQYQMQKELEDLQSTCSFTTSLVRKYKHPVWMFVVATKCDLYANELKSAENYYSPRADGPFVEQIRKLEALIGTMNFMWDAIPVCTVLEDFEWQQQRVPSALKESQRDKLVISLLRKMESACASK
jgi:GTPase SAR1 family protein